MRQVSAHRPRRLTVPGPPCQEHRSGPRANVKPPPHHPRTASQMNKMYLLVHALQAVSSGKNAQTSPMAVYKMKSVFFLLSRPKNGHSCVPKTSLSQGSFTASQDAPMQGAKPKIAVQLGEKAALCLSSKRGAETAAWTSVKSVLPSAARQ